MKFLPTILAVSAPLLVASAAIPADVTISKHQQAVFEHLSELTNAIADPVNVDQVGLIIAEADATVTNGQVAKVVAGAASATQTIDHIVGPFKVVVKGIFNGPLIDIFNTEDKQEEGVSEDALLGWLKELAGLVPEDIEPESVSLVFAPSDSSLGKYLELGITRGAAGKALKIVGGAAGHVTATVTEVKEIRLDGVGL